MLPQNLVLIYQQVAFVECFANNVFYMNEKCSVDSSCVYTVHCVQTTEAELFDEI
jgi:hypothetical protein